MRADLLIATSAIIVLAMGTGHLILTLFSPAFEPRDPAVKAAIADAPVRFSRLLLLGKANTGFNASHSLGVMVFGALYAYLALAHTAMFFASPFLMVFGAVVLASYLAIARAWWFYAPLSGVALSLAIYLAGLAVARLG